MSFIPSEKEAILKKIGMHEDDDEDQKKSSKKNFLRLDGTNCPSADMNWCNFKLKNLAPGTAPTDAVNKSQLDAAVIEADPLAIRKDGSSLVTADIPFASHKLKEVAAGTLSDDAVNKGQMDSALALKASVSYVDAADAAQDVAIAAKASVSYVDSQNASQDAVIALKASQSYVDAQNATQDGVIASKASTSYVDSQNSTQDSAIALKAATSYVDSQDALKVSKSGDSMSGTLDMSNNMVQGLSNLNFQVDGVGNIGNTGRPLKIAIKDVIYTGGNLSGPVQSTAFMSTDNVSNFSAYNLGAPDSLRGGGSTGWAQGINQGELNDIAHYVFEASPFQYSQHFIFKRNGTFKMGDLNFGPAAESHIVWGTDGGGDIGQPGQRPNNISAKLNITAGDKLTCYSLGVGNSASASTPGSVVKKIEVFDQSGTSLGFIAVYNSIS
jgi:hypothetical protein